MSDIILTGMNHPPIKRQNRETKGSRIRDAVMRLLREAHAGLDGLPTTIRFLFYELVGRGEARKPEPGKRKSSRSGWPPVYADIVREVTNLREMGPRNGGIPWNWIVDTGRTVDDYSGATNARAFLIEQLEYFQLSPWSMYQNAPLILSESKGVQVACQRLAMEYRCPITSSAGMCSGFLRTVVAPLLVDNDRPVLYLGDYDTSGANIETWSRSLLEHETGRDIEWTRLGLTEQQTVGLTPTWKPDARKEDKKKLYECYECEALGQTQIVGLVRDALDDLLPEPLEDVVAREHAEREDWQRYIRRRRHRA